MRGQEKRILDLLCSRVVNVLDSGGRSSKHSHNIMALPTCHEAGCSGREGTSIDPHKPPAP